MSRVVLRFKGVRLGSRPPLDWTVEEGEHWAIYGPDGAGKTTLLRLAVGELAPRTGRVELLGEDPRKRRAVGALGYLPQAFAQYEDLTVEETLLFFGRLHGLAMETLRTRATRLLHRVGLTDFVHRRVGHLSGGMRKKLALVTQLLHSPRILVLDEPTLGVDPLSRSEIWMFLHQVRQEQTLTLVFSTVYAEEAERSDRVLVLDPEAQARILNPRLLEAYVVVYLKGTAPPSVEASILEREAGGQWVLVSQRDVSLLGSRVRQTRLVTLDDWLLAGASG